MLPLTHASGIESIARESPLEKAVRGCEVLSTGLLPGCTGRMAESCICMSAVCSICGDVVDVSALPPKPVVTPEIYQLMILSLSTKER